jgi:signal transduction histidine kinase
MIATGAFAASLSASILNNFDPLAEPPFAPIFIIIVFTSFFWRTQTSWQGVLGRFFQWERRSYTEIRQFGQTIVGRATGNTLPETLASALVTTLQLERAAVWVWDETERVYGLAGQAGEAHLAWLERLRPATDLGPKPLRLSAGHPPDWLTPLWNKAALEIVAPLVASGQPVGLLALGKRWDEEIFDERDLEIVDLIAQQAALFLLTARQIEELRQVPQKISAAQERERFSIAQELHDTVQQFLGRLPFHLQISHDAVQADPEEAETILRRCITDVANAAQTVRQIRNNLSPLQLEKNLTLPLKLLAEHYHARHGLTLHLDIAPEAEAGLSLDARHALYRVIQQALDNIVEHAQARNVTITLTAYAKQVAFVVADDGVGLSADFRAQAAEQGSFGLKSMQARLTALGGEFEILPNLAPQPGAQVRGWLPRQLPRQEAAYQMHGV